MIRGQLERDLREEFDREWDLVLDQVKQTKELAELQILLIKWRHVVSMERTDPGSYRRMLSTADDILRTGANPRAAPLEQMQDLIERRLA